MIRLITIYLLTTAVFLQSFAPLVILADFKINQDFIAEVLCFNRDKPELHCNGQCQLNDKLNEQQEKEQNSPNQVQEKQIVFFVERLPVFALCQEQPSQVHYLPYLNGLHPDQTTQDFFHPPQFS